MGLELVESEHGWAIFETVSPCHWRESRWCETKTEIIEALIDQGISPQIVEMFDEHNHLPALIIGGEHFSTVQIMAVIQDAGLAAIDGEPMESLHPDAESKP